MYTANSKYSLPSITNFAQRNSEIIKSRIERFLRRQGPFFIYKYKIYLHIPLAQ